MAIIECAECSREISDKASACPGCGAPRTAEAEMVSIDVVTTQATAKTFKGWQLGGVGGVLVGILALGAEAPELGLFFLAGGLIMMVAASLAGWWHHG